MPAKTSSKTGSVELSVSEMNSLIEALQFNHDGLIPAIAQDASSGGILMVAYMNREAFEATVKRGEAVYYSRSRQKLWHKGESSGHTQTIVEIQLDCDGDCLVLQVVQQGGIACHTGTRDCFYRTLKDGSWQRNQEPLKSSDDIYQN